MNRSNGWKQWCVVAVFATAMAWVEAAVVYYLRTLVDRIEPYQANPLPISAGLSEAELIREFATLVMLLTVGWLAGTTWRSRLGYALIAFGVWDILYYAFLKVMTGWPNSVGDWDILFLIPLPWWGPVWAPMAIAGLMILWGTFVTQIERHPGVGGSNWKSLGLGGVGVALALFVFMADALRTADQGADALRAMLPTSFNWPLFCLALALMAVPVADVAWQAIRVKRRAAP